MQNLNELLAQAKELLKDEVTTITFETWIKGLEIKSENNGNIELLTSTDWQKETVEAKYKDLLTNTFKFILNRECTISILSKESMSVDEINNINMEVKVENNSNYQYTSLKPEYTFDTFVIGDNNSFAQAAAQAVANAPGTLYNPLYIVGGAGLGKTHLMHAIGNELLHKNKDAKILYITSETFVNDFIDSIKNNTGDSFRAKYRNVDLLLIDDIQFIAGKIKVEEEFFNTFNQLKDNNKQIVITSDKTPNEIPELEDRLITRFQWGVIAEIGKPTFETRLAILKKKVEFENIIIDNEILTNIANSVDSNIRELEGILNKLVAQTSLTHTPITMEMAEKAINGIVKEKEKIVSSEFIQETVAKYFSINVEDLKSSKRSNDVTHPRQIAMYLCRNVAGMSLPQIGKDFGHRDHTTVMHACTKIEKEIKDSSSNNSQNTKLVVESLKKILLDKF